MRKNIERVNNISQVSNHDNFNKNVLFQPMKLLHVQVFGPCRRRRAGVMLIQLFTNFENNQGIYWNLYSSTPHEIFIQNIYAHQNEEKVLNCESLLDRSELSRSRFCSIQNDCNVLSSFKFIMQSQFQNCMKFLKSLESNTYYECSTQIKTLGKIFVLLCIQPHNNFTLMFNILFQALDNNPENLLPFFLSVSLKYDFLYKCFTIRKTTPTFSVNSLTCTRKV